MTGKKFTCFSVKQCKQQQRERGKFSFSRFWYKQATILTDKEKEHLQLQLKKLNVVLFAYWICDRFFAVFLLVCLVFFLFPFVIYSISRQVASPSYFFPFKRLLKLDYYHWCTYIHFLFRFLFKIFRIFSRFGVGSKWTSCAISFQCKL